jgi:hypothetical protein
VTRNFYGVGSSSAPRPIPSLEDQGISLSLAPPSKPVRHGWRYQRYAAASIGLEFIGAHRPSHPTTKCFRQGGDTIDRGKLFFIDLKCKLTRKACWYEKIQNQTPGCGVNNTWTSPWNPNLLLPSSPVVRISASPYYRPRWGLHGFKPGVDRTRISMGNRSWAAVVSDQVKRMSLAIELRVPHDGRKPSRVDCFVRL